MRHIPRLLLFVVFLFSLTTVVLADDTGVTVITQDSVMYSGGFPHNLSHSGSYRLDSNLTVPANTDGIVITADNVTLNLNGFTIAGPVTCTGRPATSCSGSTGGRGIFTNHNDNITVTNGSIIGMGSNGVDLGGLGNLVEGVHAKFNGNNGISVFGGTVKNCSAVSNGGSGIAGSGIAAEENAAFLNHTAGFNVYGSSIIANTSLYNTIGLIASGSVYGSNTFVNNLSTVENAGFATSQNNNNCSGTTC